MSADGAGFFQGVFCKTLPVFYHSRVFREILKRKKLHVKALQQVLQFPEFILIRRGDNDFHGFKKAQGNRHKGTEVGRSAAFGVIWFFVLPRFSFRVFLRAASHGPPGTVHPSSARLPKHASCGGQVAPKSVARPNSNVYFAITDTFFFNTAEGGRIPSPDPRRTTWVFQAESRCG